MGALAITKLALSLARQKMQGWLATWAYKAAVARDESKAEWYFQLGLVQTKMEKWQAAATAYKAAIARDDTRADWYFRLGLIQAKMEKWQAAATAYQAAIARDDSRADWHFELGLARAKMEKWQAAATAYQAAIARDDSRADWHFELGLARSKMEKWQAAATAYEAAIARDDSRADWYFELGLARAKMEKWQAAATAYEAAITRDDGRADWYFELGLARAKMKKWQAAATAYEAAITHDDGRADWYFELGLARAKMKKWQAAATAYEAAIARDDGRADWYFELGLARAKMEKWEAAATAYQAAIARDDSRANWYFELGLTRAKMGEWEAEATAYESAIARDDSRADWHFRLGLARAKMEKWQTATTAYEAAITRDDSRADWHFRLGLARAKMEKWQAAATAYEAATKRDDSHDKLLRSFLSREHGEKQSLISTKILMESGNHTRLARRIHVVSGTNSHVYFEHCRFNQTGCDKVHKFYSFLRTFFPNCPPKFIPKLHYYSWQSNYGYFIFDYIKHCSDLSSRFYSDDVDYILHVGTKCLGHLIFLSQKFKDVNLQANIMPFYRRTMQEYLEREIELNYGDDDYTEMLRSLYKQESSHFQNFSSLPLVFCHGDAGHQNLILDDKGEVYIIDWDSFGLGKIGLDLVVLFNHTWDSDVFERLVDYYFKVISETVPVKDRRYIVALLTMYYSITHNKAFHENGSIMPLIVEQPFWVNSLPESRASVTPQGVV